ncbi:MAG: cytidylate kinase family protein [Candidatus Parvarchaeota archaeon]|nr:cytidylate kinase family protein [Candidatus Parvarchaeota archaeon]
MRIIISGLTASGKSTLARSLSKSFKLEYFSGSSKLKELIPKEHFEFWESKKGLDAIRFRLKHPQYDRSLDNYIIKNIKARDNLILDSWVASWKVNLPGIIKIYLKVDIKERVRRVSERDGISIAAASKFMREKDRLTSKIYRDIYGIDVLKDLTPFDLVINSTYLSADELRRLCVHYIESLKR